MIDDKRINDLKIQAMMFDMEVDWETLALEPKKPKLHLPFWLKRWKEKREQSDYSEHFDVDKE